MLEPGQSFRRQGGPVLTVERSLWDVDDHTVTVRSVEGPLLLFSDTDELELA
jgi:hypothetical protein